MEGSPSSPRGVRSSLKEEQHDVERQRMFSSKSYDEVFGIVPASWRLAGIVERIFSFKSVKFVEVRHRRLGISNFLLRVGIFIYVIGFQILYANRHFERVSPRGMGRMKLKHPVQHHCHIADASCLADFTPMEELPYCKVDGVDRDSSAFGSEYLHFCEYMDEMEMNPSGKLYSHKLVPTRITTSWQHETGKCGADGKKPCDNVYEFGSVPDKTRYIADIERFTLLIDHSFAVPTEAAKLAPLPGGCSFDFTGSFEVCEDPLDKHGCKEVDIPKHADMKGEPGEGPGFFSTHEGDVIPMGHLLKLAGVDLNNSTNQYGEPRRYEGFILEIKVDYRNLDPFTSLSWTPWVPGQMKYVYRIGMLPLETYKEVATSYTDGGRIMEDKHGIFVRVVLSGYVAYLDTLKLIMVITTSVTLLLFSDDLLDLGALYCWRHSKEFRDYKYDQSQDFTKLRGAQDSWGGLCAAGHDYTELGESTATAPPEQKAWQSMTKEDFVRKFQALDGDMLGAIADGLNDLSQECDQAVDNHKELDENHEHLKARHRTMKLKTAANLAKASTAFQRPD